MGTVSQQKIGAPFRYKEIWCFKKMSKKYEGELKKKKKISRKERFNLQESLLIFRSTYKWLVYCLISRSNHSFFSFVLETSKDILAFALTDLNGT